MGKMAGRPMLQDLLKAAMVDSAARVRITEEAYLQSEKVAEGKMCKKCGKEKCACGDKMASAPESEHVEKLASACDFCAELLKQAASMAGPYGLTEHLQTSAPGVSHATASKSLPDHKGQGVNVVPMHPSQQKGLSTENGATQMENTQAAGVAGKMPPNIVNGKHASAGVVSLIRSKLAADEHEKKETEGMEEAKKGLDKAEAAHKSEPENKEGSAPSSLADYLLARTKVAEDAINPARISAGPAVPPETSMAGQPGGNPAGGPPRGPTSHVQSNQAAIDAKKSETHGPRREELKKYFNEPALSAEHDRVLQVAFDHTGKAGTKFASAAAPAESVKTAAARVLLSKLAEAAEGKESAAAAAGA